MNSFRKPLKILRYDGEAELMADGTYQYPRMTELPISASVQALKPNEMELLPEGSRTARAVKVYSDVELFAVNQSKNLLPDRFVWRGMMFEVIASDIYQSDVINHYRAYAVEVKRY